jgi:leucyl aminopeptidase
LSDCLVSPDTATDAVPIHLIESDDRHYLDGLSESQRTYVAATGFKPRAGQLVMVPDSDGRLALALFGLGRKDDAERTPFLPGKLADLLPPGTYRLAGPASDRALATLAFALGSYRFTGYRSTKSAAKDPRLVVSEDVDHSEVARIVAGVTLTRDLINTPANDMGPDELETAARKLAEARMLLVAAPDYVARHGAPRSFEELSDHRLLHYSNLSTGNVWRLRTLIALQGLAEEARTAGRRARASQ